MDRLSGDQAGAPFAGKSVIFRAAPPMADTTQIRLPSLVPRKNAPCRPSRDQLGWTSYASAVVKRRSVSGAPTMVTYRFTGRFFPPSQLNATCSPSGEKAGDPTVPGRDVRRTRCGAVAPADGLV